MSVPSTRPIGPYVRLAADRTLPPDQQAASIAAIRAGGKDVTELEIDAGHMVMISRPAALADVLNAVARRSDSTA